MLRVAFIFNMKTRSGEAEAEAEWDSPETISAMERALSRNAEVIKIDASGGAGFIKKKLEEEKPSIVFNYAEGASGEAREAEIPILLESMGLPYTGSGPDSMKNCLNKAKTKTLLLENGVATPEFRVVESPGEPLEGIPFPCIVKPLWEGSSKGIRDGAVAETPAAAGEIVRSIIREYRQPALVERFLPGREFTAGIIGNGPPARVLPLVEIDHSAMPGGMAPILSYEAKWVIDRPENPVDIVRCPAPVSRRLEEEITSAALGSFLALGVRDWCRVDLRLDASGIPHVIEINPLPGLLPAPEDNSFMPAAARAAGCSYDDLVNMVLAAALERYGMGAGAGT